MQGLVLHDVSYEDAGKLRPIMHRASLVEMIVPVRCCLQSLLQCLHADSHGISMHVKF
jgi:Copper amine oxidase, enzyme domain